MVNWSTVETPLEEIVYTPPTEWEILSTANSLAFQIKNLLEQYSWRNHLSSHDRDELNKAIILLEAMKTAHGLVGDENAGFKFP